MNIYTGLLFQKGHIADPALALSLASDATPDAPRGEAGPRSEGLHERDRTARFPTAGFDLRSAPRLAILFAMLTRGGKAS